MRFQSTKIKIIFSARSYVAHINAFTRNARLYLLNVIITGATMGVFRLLFNFYALSLGFNETLLGNLVTTSSLTALVTALPMGYLADHLGRKKSFMISGLLVFLATLMMVIFPYPWVLYLTNVTLGLAQSLGAVTMAPFMMENSGEMERTYLFSFSSGLQMASASLGSWVGGYLPSWVAAGRSVAPTSSMAYSGALLIIAVVGALALIPLGMIRSSSGEPIGRSVFAPLAYARRNPRLLGRLILPMLVTSIGAGLIMPFMNVFFRQNYGQPDPAIGMIFAWGSLSMGLGLMAAPPLADRMGKIQFVVITQALSIPFLALLGFAPWFWLSAGAYLVRVALMNMSGPVYQTYVMEHVEQSARAMVSSLVSMSWNFGWTFSPTISGWLQVQFGFAPAFVGTILLYSLSIYFYWSFFWRGNRRAFPINPSLAGK